MSTTVAGGLWVSANLLRLWRSLSSAAFLAVALMWATVTCKQEMSFVKLKTVFFL